MHDFQFAKMIKFMVKRAQEKLEEAKEEKDA